MAEAAGETVTALSAPGGAVPLSYPRFGKRESCLSFNRGAECYYVA